MKNQIINNLNVCPKCGSNTKLEHCFGNIIKKCINECGYRVCIN